MLCIAHLRYASSISASPRFESLESFLVFGHKKKPKAFIASVKMVGDPRLG
ncbi:hypothetical protein VDG1235_1168 [Verrucomicrobiia bacterium DG1235]|nr:hypothetical protein VDG1235_1168 [Verrucomicrobiae bacterium DG1235]